MSIFKKVQLFVVLSTALSMQVDAVSAQDMSEFRMEWGYTGTPTPNHGNACVGGTIAIENLSYFQRNNGVRVEIGTAVREGEYKIWSRVPYRELGKLRASRWPYGSKWEIKLPSDFSGPGPLSNGAFNVIVEYNGPGRPEHPHDREAMLYLSVHPRSKGNSQFSHELACRDGRVRLTVRPKTGDSTLAHKWFVHEMRTGRQGEKLGEGWGETGKEITFGTGVDNANFPNVELENGECYKVVHGLWGECHDWSQSSEVVCVDLDLPRLKLDFSVSTTSGNPYQVTVTPAVGYPHRWQVHSVKAGTLAEDGPRLLDTFGDRGRPFTIPFKFQEGQEYLITYGAWTECHDWSTKKIKIYKDR